MVRTPTKAPDFDMVQLDPPPSLTGDQKALQRNLEKLCKEADGHWYRVGRFEGAGAAANRASSFRKRQSKGEFEKKVEFKGITLDEPDDGYKSELYARWTGVPGQAGLQEQPLRALPGGGGKDDEDGDAPTRRGPGRPPGSRNKAAPSP